MAKKLLFFATIISLSIACSSGGTETSDAAKIHSFGEQITAEGAIAYSDLLAKMTGEENVDAKVKGTVTSVCQVKGCWITITPEKEGDPELFVKFKDYGFFMPMDIAGREVIMDGYAFVETTSVEELRHYAEDEGKSKEEIEEITEPEKQYKFMASGVLLLPAN